MKERKEKGERKKTFYKMKKRKSVCIRHSFQIMMINVLLKYVSLLVLVLDDLIRILFACVVKVKWSSRLSHLSFVEICEFQIRMNVI